MDTCRTLDDGAQFPVQITNFVNPHFFHFKLENVCDAAVEQIEKDLQKHVNSEHGHITFEPIVGDWAMAFVTPMENLSFGKWVRVHIDMVLEEDDGMKYIIWCVDRGVSMKVSGRHLLPLPRSMQTPPVNLFFGGIANCVPVEQKLNFATMTYEVTGSNDFADIVVRRAKLLIDESSEMFFVPRIKLGQQIFGDLKMTTHRGNVLNMADELGKLEGVKVGRDFIQRGIENLFTTKKNRFRDNVGQLTVTSTAHLHQFSKPTTVKMEGQSITSDLEYEQSSLVLNWSQRNVEMAHQSDVDLIHNFRNVLDEIDVFQPEEDYAFDLARPLFHGSSNSVLHYRSNMTTASSLLSIAESPSTEYSDATGHAGRLTGMQVPSTDSTNNKNKPTKKVPTKRVAYIPSGHESDLVNFQKYNFF